MGRRKSQHGFLHFGLGLGIFVVTCDVIFVVTCDVMTGTVHVHHIPEIEFIRSPDRTFLDEMR